MKINLLTKIIVSMTFCVAALNVPTMVEASSNKYSCLKVNGVYGIYAHSDRGKIKLMSFVRDVSEDLSSNVRCQDVATRFQRFSDNGILRLISSGYVNNEPVLCAVVEQGQVCNAENILVTLPPESEPIEAARRLMDTRALALGRPIEVNGQQGKLESYVNGHTYYDLAVLEKLILEQKNSDRLIEN
ncbi:MAG: hypothetical protein RLZZ69_1085 [Cyanobacteriota bacterium]